MPTEYKQLLIIEDDKDFVAILREILEREDFRVLTAYNRDEGIARFYQHRLDLVILDINLPLERDGFEVLEIIRDQSNIPVIIVSAIDTQMDKIEALKEGADDYITKPVDPSELIARINALLRRAGWTPAQETMLKIGDLRLDLARRQVHRNNQPLELTPTEFAILALLMQNAGETVTYADLLQTVWGGGYEGNLSILRVNISRLRTKLSGASNSTKYIKTDAKVGYKISLDPE